MIITAIQYVTVARSLDNDGEGSILAIVSLVATDPVVGSDFL